jgi:haloalkane dehalogenase
VVDAAGRCGRPSGLRERAALIVWGGRDFCFDDTFLARWQRELPGAQVHRIADAGHYVLDDARDESNT